MSFNRKSLFYKRSLAWRLFKRHHTHFNDIYWAHRTAHAHAYTSTRPHARTDKTEVLFAYAVNNPSVPPTLGQWADCYSEFDDWTRMAAVVAIAGYLETYIAQVCTAALESCPSLLFGGGPDIDGAIYLKHNPRYDLFKHTEPLTRGTWQGRIAAYKTFFESCPFEAHLTVLEDLRSVRNDAGHSFGRNIKSMNFATKWIVEKLPGVSDARLLGYLAVVEAVAMAIESHVASQYVGQYEVIKAFHRWLPKTKVTTASPKVLAREFSLHMNSLTKNNYGKPAAVGLIKYYGAL